MGSYAGLDVSQQATQVCVLDAGGAVVWTGKVRTDPAALAAVLRERAPGITRAVLESGALSGRLCGGLVEPGLPAVCIDARAAQVTSVKEVEIRAGFKVAIGQAARGGSWSGSRSLAGGVSSAMASSCM
jgi:transposase